MILHTAIYVSARKKIADALVYKKTAVDRRRIREYSYPEKIIIPNEAARPLCVLDFVSLFSG